MTPQADTRKFKQGRDGDLIQQVGRQSVVELRSLRLRVGRKENEIESPGILR